MQVIGQNHDGLDGKWPAAAGRLQHLPQSVDVFGQEFPAAVQQIDCEEEGAARNKGANVLRHKAQSNCLRRDALRFPALQFCIAKTLPDTTVPTSFRKGGF